MDASTWNTVAMVAWGVLAAAFALLFKKLDAIDVRLRAVEQIGREENSEIRHELREDIRRVEAWADREIKDLRVRLHNVEPAKATLDELMRFLKERDARRG